MKRIPNLSKSIARSMSLTKIDLDKVRWTMGVVLSNAHGSSINTASFYLLIQVYRKNFYPKNGTATPRPCYSKTTIRSSLHPQNAFLNLSLNYANHSRIVTKMKKCLRCVFSIDNSTYRRLLSIDKSKSIFWRMTSHHIEQPIDLSIS